MVLTSFEQRPPEILVVDDQVANLEILVRLLEKQHFEVRVATSGAHALVAAQAAVPDLILLDIMMPDLDGYEVCARLKQMETFRDVPVIFLSALDSVQDKVTAFEAGGVDYITKPFQHAEVLARVRTHLAVHQLQRTQAHLAAENARLYQETQAWAQTLEQQVTERTKELQQALQKEQTLRKQLIQAGKLAALGQMVAAVAHELNNPLQTIRNCLFLVEEKTKQDPPTHEFIQLAAGETQRLSDLVLQLRKAYRPDLAEQQQPVDLTALLSDLRKILKPQIERSQVVWEFSTIPVRLMVNANPDHLHQVFLNLALNAIEAMQPDGGRLMVRIQVTPDSRQIGVAFKDTGRGIPPENLEHMFEPFFTTKEMGTGLGLAISYDIIAQHGGRIEVENTPGSGAKFTVWLPLMRSD